MLLGPTRSNVGVFTAATAEGARGRCPVDGTVELFSDARDQGETMTWLGEMIAEHLEGRGAPNIVFSREPDELLDTGGGVTKALPLLGKAPFFVANGDVVWLDGRTPAFDRLAGAWDDKKMDALREEA